MGNAAAVLVAIAAMFGYSWTLGVFRKNYMWRSLLSAGLATGLGTAGVMVWAFMTQPMDPVLAIMLALGCIIVPVTTWKFIAEALKLRRTKPTQ